jgi:decaprenylphospho-beta-D-erythro-pentofuranosid-2-ulose 2-reductase
MKKIVLLGAYSAIVFETARIYAKDGASFILLGRSAERLEQTAQDLTARGASQVECIAADLADLSKHQELYEEILKLQPDTNLVISGYGQLSEQAAAEKNFQLVEQTFNINFLSVASWLEKFAQYFKEREAGTLAVITSVAGDRGRKSNYVYGASKAALSTYLQGLRNRLSTSGVGVLDIKPGFVDTPMTANLKKGLLFASPEKIAQGIYAAINKQKDQVYLPFFWFFIMLIIRNIPERIFKKMSI